MTCSIGFLSSASVRQTRLFELGRYHYFEHISIHAYVVDVNFGNVKSSRILTFFDASPRYFVSITFTAYVSEYSSYQWLPEGKNNKIVYTF